VSLPQLTKLSVRIAMRRDLAQNAQMKFSIQLQFSQVCDEVPVRDRDNVYSLQQVMQWRKTFCIMLRRNSSLDEKYLQLTSRYLLSSGSLYHKIPSVTGTGLSARFTVCYRRPEQGLPFTVKSGVWMPSQLDIHLGLTPSPADDVDVLAFDVVRRKRRRKSVVIETKRS